MNISKDEFQSNSVTIDSDDLNQTGLDNKSYIIDDDEDSLEIKRQELNKNKNDHNLLNHNHLQINNHDAGFKLNHVSSTSSSDETSEIQRQLNDVSLEFDQPSVSSSVDSKPPSFTENVIDINQ